MRHGADTVAPGARAAVPLKYDGCCSLHVGKALLLQVYDLRVRHRYHGNEAMDITRIEPAPTRCHPAHPDVDDATNGKALRTRHQILVLCVISNGKESDLVSVQHDDNLAVEWIGIVEHRQMTGSVQYVFQLCNGFDRYVIHNFLLAVSLLRTFCLSPGCGRLSGG